jgi:hypothetical protein
MGLNPYREIMQRQGWRHAVALCFWGDPPSDLPVFVTSVFRTEGRSDFSQAEAARLESIHPFIDHQQSRGGDENASTILRTVPAELVGPFRPRRARIASQSRRLHADLPGQPQLHHAPGRNAFAHICDDDSRDFDGDPS